MLLTTKLALSLTLLQAGWLPTGLKWRTASLPTEYCISANATNTNLTAVQQRTQVTNAINAWVATGNGGSLSCTTYTAVAQAGACGTQIDGGDGQFNIFWEDNWAQGQNTIGVTWSTGSGQNCGNVTDDLGQSHALGCKFDADIEFNDNNFFWDTTGNNTDVASIAAHEYGHFIGLDHCDDNGTCNIGSAVMGAAYPGGLLRVPFADDIQGACALYPGMPGGLGWPCNANNTCTSGICVNPGAAGYCTELCGTCASGYACGPNPQNAAQMVCLRDDGLNKQLCEVCQRGVPGACADDGFCIGGLPSQNEGRCVSLCGAGCPTDYQCLQIQFQDGSTEDYCFPRSNDCNDPGNFTELQLGQQCSGNPPCVTGLTCVGICAPACNPGACPANWGCESFQGGNSFCLPGVHEAQSCEGLLSCLDGPCLVVNARATCFQDCAGNPGACNNAQMCNTYNLSGGGSVSICEPPGVPPNPPDGGVITPDTGVPPVDGGTPDSGVGPDGTTGLDAGPGIDGGPGIDAGSDGGTGRPDTGSGPGPMVCACDTTFSCDGCDCDPECQPCECDTDYACDSTCKCDAECKDGCQCTAAPTQADDPLASPLFLLGLCSLLLARRRASW